MRRALELAAKGLGNVEPNPAVGAVIVKNGRVIGRSWHKKFGGPHAEIEALADCRKRGNSPEGATMYVTLEPCCHFGKTGPCTDALIAAKLKRVVVATLDPSKHANGKGIGQLRKAGIKIEVGLCERQARLLNAPFFKFAKTGKCWVTVKWAQSIDGKLAYTDSTNRWVSSEQSRKDSHELRRRAGAILVGINTVLKDDPLLTPRPSKGKKPMRIVLDNRLRIPLDSQLLATAKDIPVLIVMNKKTLKAKSRKAEQIKSMRAEVLGCSAKSNLRFLLDELSRRGVQQLLVEGGPTVIGSFLRENLADAIVVYVAPRILGTKGRADVAKAMRNIDTDIGLDYVDIKRFGDDVRVSGLTANGAKWSGLKGV